MAYVIAVLAYVVAAIPDASWVRSMPADLLWSCAYLVPGMSFAIRDARKPLYLLCVFSTAAVNTTRIVYSTNSCSSCCWPRYAGVAFTCRVHPRVSHIIRQQQAEATSPKETMAGGRGGVFYTGRTHFFFSSAYLVVGMGVYGQ